MKILQEPEFAGRTLTMVEVTNIGDRPTTISNLTIHRYKNWWYRFWGKADEKFFVKNPGSVSGQNFPHKLNVGEIWQGFVNQPFVGLSHPEDGILIFQIHFSSQKRPVSKRVRFDTDISGTADPVENEDQAIG